MISSLRPELGMNPRFSFDGTELDPSYSSLLPIQGVFVAKGWSRTVAAFTVLLAGYQRDAFWKARVEIGN